MLYTFNRKIEIMIWAECIFSSFVLHNGEENMSFDGLIRKAMEGERNEGWPALCIQSSYYYTSHTFPRIISQMDVA